MNRFRHWIPVAVWSAMIFGLSSIPGYDLPPPPSFLEYFKGFVQLDKFVHHLLFAGFAWLCVRAMVLHRPTRNLAGTALLAALLASAFGATDEWHQILTPGRSCDFFDWLSDTSGGAVGAGLAALAYAILRRSGRFPFAREPS